MNKKIAKRRQELKEKIFAIEDQIESKENEIEDLIGKGETKGQKTILESISILTKKKVQLRFLRKCLLYPTKLVLKDALKDIEDFIKDNEWDKDTSWSKEDLNGLIDGYVGNYLGDNFGNELECEYVWATTENSKDIFITRLRWFDGQLIKEDLKDIARGKLDHFENAFVEIYKHPFFKGALTLTFKDSGYSYMATPKQAQKELEKRCLM